MQPLLPLTRPRSFFIIAPFDTVRMLPALRITTHGGRLPHAVFYYEEEPHNALKQTPHGIIALDAGATVEPFAASGKHQFCVRICNAQQQLRRTTKHT